MDNVWEKTRHFTIKTVLSIYQSMYLKWTFFNHLYKVGIFFPSQLCRNKELQPITRAAEVTGLTFTDGPSRLKFSEISLLRISRKSEQLNKL